MNPIRAIAILCLVLVTLPLSIQAQRKSLSPQARKLTDALSDLQKEPDDPDVQERYLKAFPQDYKSFLALFDLDRELYDGHEFIVVLPSLARNHEAEAGHLVVQLSKDAHWDADAPNYLKEATVAYGDEHTKIFAALLQQLPIAERANLISFLADTENFAAYPQYQAVIDHLKSLRQNNLAKEFETAKASREKRNSR